MEDHGFVLPHRPFQPSQGLVHISQPQTYPRDTEGRNGFGRGSQTFEDGVRLPDAGVRRPVVPRPRALQWPFAMQVLQAGQHKLLYLELQPDMLTNIARQVGFETRAKDGQRAIQLDLVAAGRQAPLLLFDASDPANLGWFSRCQFYVDGRTGAVMQTPITLANKRDRGGKAHRNSVRLVISKELPVSFRLPGKQPLTEQVFYSLLFDFLNALTQTGVAICGGSAVQPLAGRTDSIGPRN